MRSRATQAVGWDGAMAGSEGPMGRWTGGSRFSGCRLRSTGFPTLAWRCRTHRLDEAAGPRLATVPRQVYGVKLKSCDELGVEEFHGSGRRRHWPPVRGGAKSDFPACCIPYALSRNDGLPAPLAPGGDHDMAVYKDQNLRPVVWCAFDGPPQGGVLHSSLPVVWLSRSEQIVGALTR